MSYENNLKSDTLKYIPVKILPGLAGVLTIFLLTRSLSIPTYASYSFITASILLFMQLVSGWINSSVIYFFTDFSSINKLDVFKANIFSLQIILLIIGGGILMIVSYAGLKDFGLAMASFFLMTTQIFVSLQYSFLQAERKIKLQISSTVIQSIIQIIGVFLCSIFKPNNLAYLISALIISYFVSLVFLHIQSKKSLIISDFFTHFDFELCKRIFKYGFPICLWFFTTQFYAVGDRILFKYFNISQMVGNYASFRDLSVGISGFITMPLLLASHPILVHMWKSKVEKPEIELLLSNSIKILIDIFLPFFIGLLLLGRLIMLHFVGQKYLLDTHLMLTIFASIFLSTVSMYLHKPLEITGKTVVMLKISLLVALFSLVTNILLLPKYGVQGACFIALICQVLYCVLIYKQSNNILKIKLKLTAILKHVLMLSCAFILFFAFPEETFLSIILKSIFILIATGYIFATSEIRSIIGQFVRVRK